MSTFQGAELIKKPNIDGFLVGGMAWRRTAGDFQCMDLHRSGASLKPNFLEIVQLLPQFDWKQYQHQFLCLVLKKDLWKFRRLFPWSSFSCDFPKYNFSSIRITSVQLRKSTPPPILKKPKFTKSTDLNPTTKVGGDGEG